MALPVPKISDSDRERLIALAMRALSSDRPQPAASMLLSEIGRAAVVAKDSLPKGVVAVNSEFEIYDNVENVVRCLRLVCPADITANSGDVSVLTPLGAAVLGLSKGDTIDWCTATGELRSITVLRVRQR